MMSKQEGEKTMDYQRISGKKEQLSSVWDSLPKEAVASFNQSFAIEYLSLIHISEPTRH